jgi:hypothetical protein
MHNGQRQARIDPPSIDDHGASAALAMIAALLGAGEMQLLAQSIEQRDARVEYELAGFAVHAERYFRDGWRSDVGSLGLADGRYCRHCCGSGCRNQQVTPGYF